MAKQNNPPKKPLVISDPKEFAYRQKMYADSLNAYNSNPPAYNSYENYKKSMLNEYNKSHMISGYGIEKPVNKDVKYSNFKSQPISIVEFTATAPNLDPKTLKSIGRKKLYTKDIPVYKKPIQPVQLKKNTTLQKENILQQENNTVDSLPFLPTTNIQSLNPELIPAKPYVKAVKPSANKGVWSDGSTGQYPEGLNDWERKTREYQEQQLKLRQPVAQTFKEGGNMNPIQIKPSHEGRFTAYKERTGKTTEEALHSPNAHVRAMAQFAKNASQWHHAMGGPMDSSGIPSEQNNSQLTQFNEGGTHEENRLGGVPQGINKDGQQNMVEEGETKLNAKNYIFSNSLVVDKDIAKEFYFPSKYIGKTFADVSKIMERPKSRRTNDSIEENAKKKDLDALMSAQELHKQISLQKDMEKMIVKHPEFAQAMMAQQSPSPSEQPTQNPAMVASGAPEGLPQEAPIASAGGYQSHFNVGFPGHFKLGGDLKQGPITEADSRDLDSLYPSTVNVGIPYAPNQTSIENRLSPEALSMFGMTNEQNEAQLREGDEYKLRKNKNFDLGGGMSTQDQQLAMQTQQQLADAQLQQQTAFANQQAELEKSKKAQGIGSGVGSVVGGLAGSIIPGIGTGIGSMVGGLVGGGIGKMASHLEYGGPMNQMVLGGFKNPIVPPTYDMENVESPYIPKIATTDNTSGVLLASAGKPSWDPNEASMSMTQVNKPIEKSSNVELPPNYGENGMDSGYTDKGSPEDITVNQSGLNALGTYAPVAYNIGMGLFAKPQVMDENKYINNTKINNYRNNINPQLKASDEAFASAASGVRNAGAGGGAYLANMQGLHNQQEMSKAGIYANAENQYNDRQLQVDQINAARGDQNAAMRLQIADYNAKAKAAKQNMLGEGIKQVGQISTAKTQDDLGMALNQMYAPDFKGHFQYNNYISSLLGSK